MTEMSRFEERNDMRHAVKNWMESNGSDIYTQDNIRQFVTDQVTSAKDPLDSSDDSWREGTYGAWIGVVEFAGDELARIAEEADDSALNDALLEARAALPALPHDTHRTLSHIETANQILTRRPLRRADRAVGALALAQNLLRRREAPLKSYASDR